MAVINSTPAIASRFANPPVGETIARWTFAQLKTYVHVREGEIPVDGKRDDLLQR